MTSVGKIIDTYERSNERSYINTEVDSIYSGSGSVSGGESQTTTTRQRNILVCNICDNNKTSNSQYIILSCQCVYHVGCLAEDHFKEMRQLNLVDTNDFLKKECPSCNVKIDLSDIIHLHTKFHLNTGKLLSTHESHILDLEMQISTLKRELHNCYDYKNKLEYQRDKSKQIIQILNTF